MKSTIRIQPEDFDISEQYQLLRDLTKGIGAVVTFTGLVREFEPSGDQPSAIDSLSIQHYSGMTEERLSQIVDRAAARWNLLGVTIIHRIGELLPSEQIVFVGVASQHRNDGFMAAQFIMDYLKTQATFWKQISQNGRSCWVDSKVSDAQALKRWNLPVDKDL